MCVHCLVCCASLNLTNLICLLRVFLSLFRAAFSFLFCSTAWNFIYINHAFTSLLLAALPSCFILFLVGDRSPSQQTMIAVVVCESSSSSWWWSFGKKSPKFYIFKYNYLLITISHVLSLLSCSSTSTTSYIRNYNTGTLKIACYWMMDERGHLLAIIKKYQKTVSRTPMSQWERLSLLSPVKRGDDTEFLWPVVVSIERN